MPWSPSDAPKHTKKANTPEKKKLWADTANSVLADCKKKGGKDCEAKAIRVANSKMGGPMDAKNTFEKVPKKAFLLTVQGDNRVEFRDGPDGQQVPRLEMTIYSGKVIPNHWWWGDLVIDTSGMSFPKNKFPILEEHYSRIAFMGKPIVEDDHSIVVNPDTVVFLDNDRTTQFLADAKKGFPFEASIRADPVMIQRLMKDEVAEVNGFSMKGPGTIWRKSVFKEGSVCLFGYDSKTSAKVFSQEEQEVEVELQRNVTDVDVSPKTFKDGGEENMTLEELMAQHPELVSQIEQRKETEVMAKVEEEKTRLAKEKEELTATFTAKLEESNSKILKLEKQELIRTERDRQVEATRIWRDKLSASTIPAKVHDKVMLQVQHDKFVKDEAIDIAAFTQAIDAEIKDWTDSIDTSVRGQGGGLRSVTLSDADDTAEAEEDKKWIASMKLKAGDKGTQA